MLFFSLKAVAFISESKWDSDFNCGVLKSDEKRIDPAPCTRRYKYLLCAKNGMINFRNIVVLLLHKYKSYFAKNTVA